LLSRIAETYNCAALATNQVMASPDVFFGDPTRPIGGNVVAHTSTYRIYFKKSGKKRIARMVDSPHHPEEEVIFALGEAGVMDPEEAEKKTKKSASKKETKKTTKKNKSEIEIPEMTNTEGQELTAIEGPDVVDTDVQKLTTIETPEDLALSEALDEEFSDSAPTDV
jgi:DNA repair protein RadA